VLYIEADGKLIKTYEFDVVAAHECTASDWTIEVPPTGETSGMKAKYCEICNDLIDVGIMEPCGSHSFGEYVTDTEATTENMGIKVRTCDNCGCAEYELIDKLTQIPGEGRIPGDLNGDGTVSLMDSTLLRRYLAGWENVTIDEALADFNGDGKVSMIDSTILRRYLAGWEGVELQ